MYEKGTHITQQEKMPPLYKHSLAVIQTAPKSCTAALIPFPAMCANMKPL